MPTLTETFAALPFTTIAQLAMYLMLGAYAVYTGIFYYHWKSYGTDERVVNITLFTYLAVTLPLMLAIVLLALTM